MAPYSVRFLLTSQEGALGNEQSERIVAENEKEKTDKNNEEKKVKDFMKYNEEQTEQV